MQDIQGCKNEIQDLLNKNIQCTCGKVHHADIEDVIIENDAIKRLPDLLGKYQHKKVFLIADNNTYAAAGKKVEKILRERRFDLTIHVFKRKGQLVPDENTVGEFLIHVKKDVDIIIAVGSGTINDLSKFVSYKLGIPYLIVATAPSMDGFSAVGAPLIVDNLKTTYEVFPPKAIIADIDILKNAPSNMISAGLGDILGKYTCLCDWELSRIINGEYYCQYVVDLVRESIIKCTNNVQGIKDRDDTAIANLTEGLILTGIAMSFVGNSRPASGSEHHLSHFLEMMFLFRGKEAVLHGTKVGITTIAVIKLYQMLKSEKINFSTSVKKVQAFNNEKWQEEIRRIYQKGAPAVLALEEKSKKNSLQKHRERIQIIQKKWPEIVRVIDELVPDFSIIERILKEVGAPINPIEVGIDADTFSNSLIYGKEIRNRYTVLQLLWDLGLLEEYSKRVVDYFFQEQKKEKTFSPNKKIEILKRIKCFILDMDGTFYLGDRILDGSLQFLDSVKKCKKNFYFFTNNSSKNSKYYQEKLRKMGCVVKESDILTSNQVIIQYIKNNEKGKKIYLVGNDYLREDFKKAKIELVEDGPDLVVVGFDTTLEYQRVSRACHYIRNGTPFYAVNPDFNCPTETGFIPDCGSICAMITASTGVKPIVFGKPSHYTLQYILEHTNLKEEDIGYIGDRLYTDIAMGEGNKINTILVLSGETKKKDLANSPIKPDLVFESLQDVKKTLDLLC